MRGVVGIFALTIINVQAASGNTEETQALLYLQKYGYVENRDGTGALLSEEGIKKQLAKAVRDFQAFAGLNQTGELDPVTVELMGTPRCGVNDIIGHGATARRKKRFVLQGSRWRVNHLTYRITRYPSTARLSKRDVDETTAKAFNVWQDATGLTFEQRPSGSVHIEIRFEKYEHGDGDPFDGPGGTLAHAYFPQYGGDIHVDDTEYWTISSYRGTNLLQTMTHELGHSLGLSHSDVRSAIMAPFYRGWDPFMKLDEDDVRAIQSLYGQKVNKPPPRQTPISPAIPSPAGPGGFSPTTNNAANNICINPNINAIVKTGDGNSYIFRGDSYWKLTADSVAPGYPRKIAQDWPGLPSNLDAGFTWAKTKSTYFFKGNQYWKFQNMAPSRGYPRPITKGFPGIPASVDTAFVWGGNGKIYFFKGGNYWKFDPERKPHVREDIYPKKISSWDLPSGIDAALQWNNGRTYFFKKGQYWRFNDREFTIDRANPPFPRDASHWWFGCPKVGGLTSLVPVDQSLTRGSFKFATDEEEDSYGYVGDEDLDVESSDSQITNSNSV